MSSSEWQTVVKGGVPFAIRDSKYRDTAYCFRSVGASTNGQHVRIDICPRVHIIHGTKSGVLTTSRATKVEWEQIAYNIDMAILNANDDVGLESASREEWAKVAAKHIQRGLTDVISTTCDTRDDGSDGLLIWDDTPRGTVSTVVQISTNDFTDRPIDDVTFRMICMAPQDIAAIHSYLSQSDIGWGNVVMDDSQMLSLINAEHAPISTKTVVIERIRPDEGPVDSAMQGVENEWQLVPSQVPRDRILRIPEDLVPLRSQQQTAQSQGTAEVASEVASEAAPEDLDWEDLAKEMKDLSV